MFSVLGDKLDVQVRGLLEGEIKPEDPKPFKMAKSVFQSCMDKETIEVGSCCYGHLITGFPPGSRAGAPEGDAGEDGRVAPPGGGLLVRGGLQVVRHDLQVPRPRLLRRLSGRLLRHNGSKELQVGKHWIW